MKSLLILSVLATFACAQQQCCIGGPDGRAMLSTDVRAPMLSVVQNITVDWVGQMLRSDEAGMSNTTGFMGTAWIFGPNSTNGAAAYYLDSESQECSTFTYTWSTTQFCTNDPDYALIENVQMADNPRVGIWYSQTKDIAVIATMDMCTPVQIIDQYSSVTMYTTETIYNYRDAHHIDPNVFVPCKPTSKTMPAHLVGRKLF